MSFLGIVLSSMIAVFLLARLLMFFFDRIEITKNSKNKLSYIRERFSQKFSGINLTSILVTLYSLILFCFLIEILLVTPMILMVFSPANPVDNIISIIIFQSMLFSAA